MKSITAKSDTDPINCNHSSICFGKSNLYINTIEIIAIKRNKTVNIIGTVNRLPP